MTGKRREPSGGHQERGQPKAVKEDKVSIYEHTLKLLKEGARVSSQSSLQTPHGGRVAESSRVKAGSSRLFCNGDATDANSEPESSRPGLWQASREAEQSGAAASDLEADRPCFICLRRSQEDACAHCRRGVCEEDCRTCDGCQQVFCTQCSIPNYEERYDRTFCFECNEEREKSRQRADKSHSSHNCDRMAVSSRTTYIKQASEPREPRIGQGTKSMDVG